MQATAERIGFFGGSFDPPHDGHRAVALAAARHFGLDRVLLVPTGRQPLKALAALASFDDRLAMVAALCAEMSANAEAAFEASMLDAPKLEGGANFTIDALRQLRAERPDAELFVIVGADAFADLRRWREPEALLAIAEWIVVSRPASVMLPTIDPGAALGLTTAQSKRVYPLTDVAVPVSATAIRTRLAAGEDCAATVPAAVLQYIARHNLYTSASK